MLIGGLARVLHGSDEVTRGVDITPANRPSNLARLLAALEALEARASKGRALGEQDLSSSSMLALSTAHGELKIVPEPAGTAGYADLRRRATRQPLGEGLRPFVAAPGEPARMLEALGRDDDLPRLRALHRIIELERGHGRGRDL